MELSTMAIIIMIVTVILFASDRLPLAVVALLSMLAMAFTGCISFGDAFSGFANTATLMVIGTSMIGEAFVTTGLSGVIGRALLRLKGLDEGRFVVIVVIVGAILSALLNALIVIAIFMPIIDAVALETKGRITRKNIYLPLGIAAVFGGNLTVIGSTSMLNTSAMLEASYYGRGMNFFEPAMLGIPGILAFAAVLLIFGSNLQKKIFTFDEIRLENVVENEALTIEEKHPVWKMWAVVIIMLLCISGWIAGLNYGAVSLLGACIVIVIGCIDIKRAIRGVSWETVFIVVGTLGFAKGIELSGAGTIITEKLLQICGPLGESKVGMCIVILCISTILSNFMSNNATVGICVPIALSMAQLLGTDALPYVLCCAIGANLSVATPICTACITMTSSAGYRFKDYAKFGGLCNLLALAATIASVAIIYF